MKTIKFLVIFLSSSLCFGAAGQGTAFTYQGRLDYNGGPADGNFDLTFSLWNSPFGPSQVGSTVTNLNVSLSSGIATAKLDFGPGMFTGEDRWLEIGLRTNGSGSFLIVAPRQQLTPTPYALFSANGGGSSNVWSLNGTNIYYNGGNVGIGTTTPQENLTIAGVANYNNGVKITGSSPGGTGIAIENTSSGGHKYVLFSGGVSDSVGAGGFGLYDDTAVDYRFAISPTGNVGIGTTTPAGKLHVVGTAGNNTGVWSNFSDRRLKDHIEPMKAGSLNRLLQLEGVTYEYTRPDLREGYDGVRRGWIAQQVETVFPEWVSEAPDGMKMVTPVGFNALTVEALRELRAEDAAAVRTLNATLENQKQKAESRIEKLEAENTDLKKKNEALEQRLDALENIFALRTEFIWKGPAL